MDALGNVAEFINGRAFKPEEWSTTGLPIIRIQNLTGSSTELNFYDGNVETRYLIEKNDILISWSASLGVYIWQGPNAVLNQHIFKVKLKEGIERLYFYYAAINALDEMISQVHGATMQHITKDKFDAIQIPLPPPREQRLVSAILEKADHLRRTRRYAQQLSDTFLQSVFLEMFGNPASNPMGWDSVTIDEMVSKSQYGSSEKSNAKKSGYPILGMSNLTYTGDIDLTAYSYVDLPTSVFQELRLVPGDIIFNRTNSTELVGKTAHWSRDMEAVLASYLVKLQLEANVLPDFFASLLNSAYFKRLFQERCKKAIGQSNISPTLLKEFRAYLPPVAFQEKYALIVRSMERLRAQQREATRQAEHLFQTLLHQAFRGDL